MKGLPSSRRIVVAFLALDVLLVALYVAHNSLHDPFGSFFADLVGLDGESNLPAWYSSMKLCLIGFLFMMLRSEVSVEVKRMSGVLLALALVFFALSLDEIAGLHEHIGQQTDILLPGQDRRNTPLEDTGIWMFVLAPPLVLILFVLLRKLRRELATPSTIAKFFVGVGVFVGSAAGTEILINFVSRDNKLLRGIQVCAEEFGEMVGVTIILWATYDLLVHHRAQVRYESVQA